MTTGFRSLADQLRAWPDERLAALLEARPDLATPAPQDSAQLAARAATRSSLLRALDQLDRLRLAVLDAVVVLGHTDPDELAETVHADRAHVASALESLVDLALVWHSAQGLRALTGVAEALGPTSVPSYSEPRVAAVDALLTEISAPARALLEHVASHGGEATTGKARTTITPAEAATPAEELIARRLLQPRSNGTCVVPGEVAVALRGGRTTTQPVDTPPGLATAERDQKRVDQAAAGAAFEAVRRVELLLDGWSTQPPPALRSGGLGVRDLRAAAVRLHVDEPVAALLIEVARAAGLVTSAPDPDGSLAWLPTDLFDTWLGLEAAERWQLLARAWLTMARMPALVGSKDSQGKTWNALVPELSGLYMAETRQMTLGALATVPEGQVLAPGTGTASLVTRLEWERPRRPRTRAEQAAWTLDEAGHLGLTGLGGLSSYARVLLRGGDPIPVLAELLPEPVDHVLLQADLTAVAPGPLESTLARRLGLVADVESRGGATVYRFTSGSVRRAMDVGWSAAELHAFVAAVSRTPVPQPLTYLIDDTARTFGTIRVGYAEAYLRADDESVLTELLAVGASLGLRRLAPTILVSTTPLDVLLPRLRELGVAPVVEAEDGTVHLARPDALRARTPREQRQGSSHARAGRDHSRVGAVVTAIRAGDAVSSSRPSSPTSLLSPTEALAALREAIDADTAVVIGYVDRDGATADRIVTPRSIDGGQLRALDHRADELRSFAVSRIRTVRPVGVPG